jgi:hypothetical protein
MRAAIHKEGVRHRLRCYGGMFLLRQGQRREQRLVAVERVTITGTGASALALTPGSALIGQCVNGTGGDLYLSLGNGASGTFTAQLLTAGALPG